MPNLQFHLNIYVSVGLYNFLPDDGAAPDSSDVSAAVTATCDAINVKESRIRSIINGRDKASFTPLFEQCATVVEESMPILLQQIAADIDVLSRCYTRVLGTHLLSG